MATVAEALKALAKQEAAPLVELLDQRQKPPPRKRGGRTKAITAADDEEKTAGEDDKDLDDQIRDLPRKALDACYPAMVEMLQPLEDEQIDISESMEKLQMVECIARFTTLLVEATGAAIDPPSLFDIAQRLHDYLLRLSGDNEQVLATQDAISALCEACWKCNFNGTSHTLVTQLLPYLIVRSYEAPATGQFNSRKHPIRRLYAIKDALSLLDLDDESSGLLRDILLRCFIQPTFFRSPDAVPFLSYLFELHEPYVKDINETIRNQIPNQRRSILKKYASIYFKAWVGSSGVFRESIEELCIQRYVQAAVHASSISLFTSVRQVLQIFFENKRHTGVDEMLYRICSPILWRGVKAANDSVRRQAAILLFDNFPLRDPQFNTVTIDQMLQKQFDAFEELLGDSHPAVRIAAIQGVSKVLSVYWELMPAETIRCFISKLVVDLVNDASSSGVRAAVFEGLQFILDNHNSHSILKPLLPMLSPLINDRNDRVRAEFAALLVRIKSIRNIHFYDVVSVDDLLNRLIQDRDCPIVRKQLISLFLNSYFPQGVGGSSQVARSLALIKKNPEAAMVFYGSVVDQASVGSVCKLSALLLRCSLNFVSRKLKKMQGVDDENEEDEDEEEGDEDGFSIVGQIVVLEVIASLLKSVHKNVMTDSRYSECKTFLAEQLSIQSLESLLVAYSDDQPFNQEALSSLWKIIGYLGEVSQGSLLERLVENLMSMDESSSKMLLNSLVDCLVKWDQLVFLVTKIEDFLSQWKESKFIASGSGSAGGKSGAAKTKKGKKPAFNWNPIVVLGTVEYIVQAPSVQCPTQLLKRLLAALETCVTPLLDMSADDVGSLYKANSFGFMRLLEVYAKFAVLAQCAHVTQETSVLLERSVAKNVGRSREDMEALQPSAYFKPPTALASLGSWVTSCLVDMRKAADEANEDATGAKKRRRGGGKATASSNEDGKSPQEELLTRWRNLFALIALLSAESIGFALQSEVANENATAAQGFVDTHVADLTGALDRMPSFERTIFYHSCQLLHLLEGARKQQKPASGSFAQLTQWTELLQRALSHVHEKQEDQCEDLWAVVSGSLIVLVAATE